MLGRTGAVGYAFENYRLDLVRGCVVSGKIERALRRQSLLVLVYLLERPGMLIGKDELAAAIWHDTAVTDNALVQCIAEIRRAIDDDPRNPRLIKTIPKLGYRFIAEVTPIFAVSPSHAETEEILEPPGQVVESSPISSLQVAPAEQPLTTAKMPGARPWYSALVPPIRLAIMTASLLVLIFGMWGIRKLYFSRNVNAVNAVATARRPSIAILYFENKTGDADLGWLSEGLADMMIADLGSSEQVNVLSREQLHSLFPDGGTNYSVSKSSALAVGQRANADTIVLGSFSKTREWLQLNLDIYDGRTGKQRAHEQAVVADPQEIVVQANLLSVRLASDIGLSSPPVPNLPDVMTSNVEAYRYYSLGVEKAQNFQNARAIELLKKATEFDPHFAMAFARIGYAYAVTDFFPAKGRPYLEKALQLSAGLSDKDRLYVRAWDDIAKGDYTEAANAFHQIIDTYPGESEAYCQLGRLLRGEEKTEEAITLLHKGLENNSKSANLYNVLGVTLLGAHRYSEAIDAEKHAVELSPGDPNAHDSLGMAYEQSGDYYAAISEYSAALALDPEFESSAGHLGDTYFQQGRLHDAVRQYQRSIQVTQSNTVKAIGYGSLVTIYRAMGNLSAAQTAAVMEMKYEPTAVWDGILVALDRDENKRAMALERTLLSGQLNRERGTWPNMRTQFYNQGYLAMRRGDRLGAIMNFRAALQHLPASSGIDLHEDCLANAYLQFAMWPEAIAEYERILKLNPNYPLAQFHLAEAYSHLGDTQHAREAYARFLHSWQSADSDSREIREARSRVNPA